MKNVFKMAIVVVAATMTAFTASAQEKGDMAAGVNLVLGTGDALTNFGIGAKFQYNILDPLRLEASFTYFLPKDYGFGVVKMNMWDLGVNAHWLFRMNDKLNLYPLAGLGILGYNSKIAGIGGGGDSDFALNIGGGVDFKVSEKILLNAEAKYKIGGVWDRFLVSAGVGFMF